MGIFLFALILATLVEGTVEYVLGKYPKAKPFLMYVALAFGVGLAFAYKVDLLAQAVAALDLQSITLAPAWVGHLVSGIIIGRGSNYLNDFITFLTGLGKNRTVIESPEGTATKTTVATEPAPTPTPPAPSA